MYVTLAANVSYCCDRSYIIAIIHSFRVDYVTIIHLNGSGKLKCGARFSSEKHIVLMLQEIMHVNNTLLGRGGVRCDHKVQKQSKILEITPYTAFTPQIFL